MLSILNTHIFCLMSNEHREREGERERERHTQTLSVEHVVAENQISTSHTHLHTHALSFSLSLSQKHTPARARYGDVTNRKPLASNKKAFSRFLESNIKNTSKDIQHVMFLEFFELTFGIALILFSKKYDIQCTPLHWITDNRISRLL